MIAKTTELQGSSRPKDKPQAQSKGTSASNSYADFDMRMDIDDYTTGDRMDVEELSFLTRQADLVNEALLYGQELQSEFKDDTRREVKQALKDTFALIAYPDARESSLAPLLEAEGRTSVAEELNSAILGKMMFSLCWSIVC